MDASIVIAAVTGLTSVISCLVAVRTLTRETERQLLESGKQAGRIEVAVNRLTKIEERYDMVPQLAVQTEMIKEMLEKHMSDHRELNRNEAIGKAIRESQGDYR